MRIADLENLAIRWLRCRRCRADPSIRTRRSTDTSEVTEVGPIAMHEIDVDEGGKGLVTMIGRVLWWHGGDDVEVR
jgi:hypothetical protein